MGTPGIKKVVSESTGGVGVGNNWRVGSSRNIAATKGQTISELP